MTEVAPGIHQLKVPIPNNPLENTNVYLLRDNNGHILIDTGWNNEASLQALLDQLSAIDVDVRDIAQIVATHLHYDHYGLAGRLRELSGARIILHERDRDILLLRESNLDNFLSESDRWYHNIGVPDSELKDTRMLTMMRRSGTLVMPDVTVSGGETISSGDTTLNVIWTPGHSRGHICLYEPNRGILFTGDHVLPVITPSVILLPFHQNNPLYDFLGSLSKIRHLDASLVLPAHGHIFRDLPGRIDEIINHHEQRNMEILTALGDEPMTAFRISGYITWMPDTGGIHFDELAPMSRLMALSEALAHLEAMTLDGRVIKSSLDGLTYYQRV